MIYNDIELRKIDQAKEASALFELERRSFFREFDLPSRNVQEQMDYLKDSEVFALYENKNMVGFFALRKKGGDVELLVIAVDPKKQGNGYGKIMMDRVLKLTENKTIHLVTHPQNSGAIRFYLKHGFMIDGWKDDYYGDGEPRLLLLHK